MLKDDVLHELENNRSRYLSGQELADRYGVSRNAIWKAVNSLKKEGYGINSVTNRGYILCDDGGVLSGAGIASRLSDDCKDVQIHVYDVVDSTNNEAKRLLASDCDMSNCLIVCNEQKSGRGRYGREFNSPRGEGVYMTLVYKLNSRITDTHAINVLAAQAVTDAVDATLSISVSVNDEGGIYRNNIKYGGILLEAVTGIESGYYGHIITGVGINMSIASGKNDFHRNELIASIVGKLIEAYRSGADS